LIFPYFHWLLGRELKSNQQYAKGKALDIGCGDKPYQQIFKGIDQLIGTNSADYYNELDVLPSETDVICNDGVSLPFLDEEFDTVLNFQVLPVFKDMDAFFEEVYRVLKPNGILMLSTDFLYPIWNAPDNYWRTTTYGLSLLAENNGFEVIRVAPLGGYYSMQGRLLIRFLRTKMAERIKLVRISKGFSKLCHLFWLCIVILRTILAPVWVNAMLSIYTLLDRIEFDEEFTTAYLLIAQKK
jgi:SAM-dependent methyltransferase